MNNDLINAGFELFGGVAAFRHSIQLIKDKRTLGVSALGVAYFCLWGAWNLHYYNFLNQPLSYYGSIGVFSANTLWLVLIIYYRNRKQYVCRAEGEINNV